MPRISDFPVDEEHMMIKILDFRDRSEYELYKKKIQQMLKESRYRVKVF